MKEGRIFVEALKLSSVTRHQDLVEPGMAKAIYSADPESPWLAKEFAAPAAASRRDCAPADIREKRIASEAVENEPRGKGAKTGSRTGQSARQAVPTLRKRTLKVSGRVPRILPVKFAAESRKEEEPIKIEVVLEQRTQPMAIPVVELPQMELPSKELPQMELPRMEPPQMELPSLEIPSHVQVKVIPTPKKRGPRSVALAEEPNTPPVTKPLKVIRKRREEAPKIFETAPKPVPQAMLEGIKTSQENGDQID